MQKPAREKTTATPKKTGTNESMVLQVVDEGTMMKVTEHMTPTGVMNCLSLQNLNVPSTFTFLPLLMLLGSSCSSLCVSIYMCIYMRSALKLSLT